MTRLCTDSAQKRETLHEIKNLSLKMEFARKDERLRGLYSHRSEQSITHFKTLEDLLERSFFKHYQTWGTHLLAVQKDFRQKVWEHTQGIRGRSQGGSAWLE